MPLHLRYPDDWSCRPFERGVLCVVPGYALVPDITLEVHPLVPRVEVRADRILASRWPVGASLAASSEVPAVVSAATTETGWEMGLVEARVLDASGATLETRLLCCYSMLAYTGVVLVRASHARRWEAVREGVLGVLRTARPRFRKAGEVAELSELWDLESRA